MISFDFHVLSSNFFGFFISNVNATLQLCITIELCINTYLVKQKYQNLLLRLVKNFGRRSKTTLVSSHFFAGALDRYEADERS